MSQKIILGDCVGVIERFPAGKIDMVLTSPPYDNLREYNNSSQWSFDIFCQVAKGLTRILKPGGVIVWIVADATQKGSETGTSFRQALFFKEVCKLNIHDTMIWEKYSLPKNHNRYESCFEYMFIFSKGRPKTFNGLRDKRNSQAGRMNHTTFRDKDGITKKTSSFMKIPVAEFGLRTNVWNHNPCITREERNGHPAPFPSLLAADHISTWSNEREIILDPFMGSGTTGIACKMRRRAFIGIEKDVEYFKIAKQRLENFEWFE